METKVCKVCGRELPLSDYRMTRWGKHSDRCRDCIKEKSAETRYNRTQVGKTAPFFDEAFEGKQPVEVIQFMARAKRWLEAQGYTITLKGTYTQVREIKF